MTTTLLQSPNGHRLDAECRAIAEELGRLGQSYQIAATSQLSRNRVDSTRFDLVVGDLTFVKQALNQRNLEMPADDCYPLALRNYLKREVWQGTLIQACYRAVHEPVFVKPSLRTKRFTGLVLNGDNDYRLHGIPDKEPVWMSEVVHWLSESRAYILHGEVLKVSLYAGDPDSAPDEEFVRLVVETLSQQADTPGAYSLDVGVLSDGQTALIEMNAAYSIGLYQGMPGAEYHAFLKAGWAELLRSAQPRPPRGLSKAAEQHDERQP